MAMIPSRTFRENKQVEHLKAECAEAEAGTKGGNIEVHRAHIEIRYGFCFFMGKDVEVLDLTQYMINFNVTQNA